MSLLGMKNLAVPAEGDNLFKANTKTVMGF